MVVGDKVEMQPCFRDILKPDRHVPWLPWRNHENRYLVSRTGRHQPDWRMATASENASRLRRAMMGPCKLSNVAPSMLPNCGRNITLLRGAAPRCNSDECG